MPVPPVEIRCWETHTQPHLSDFSHPESRSQSRFRYTQLQTPNRNSSLSWWWRYSLRYWYIHEYDWLKYLTQRLYCDSLFTLIPMKKTEYISILLDTNCITIYCFKDDIFKQLTFYDILNLRFSGIFIDRRTKVFLKNENLHEKYRFVAL